MKLHTSTARCNKKISYASARAANKALNNQPKPRNQVVDTMRPYQCNICNKWHLGHKYKKGMNDNIHKIFEMLNEPKIL